MDRIQEKMAKKVRTLRLSELNGPSLLPVAHFENLLSITLQMCRTFKIYFTFLALIILET